MRHDINDIDALLPQTQCRLCGYAACRPYAEAIAAGSADINLCPPGGTELIRALATLQGVAYKPLANNAASVPPAAALIDESLCIGCTLCIAACPVDAIVGAVRLMHTVVAQDCTGCGLCVAPCPVDCIALQEIVPQRSATERLQSAQRWRERHAAHLIRLKKNKAERPSAHAQVKEATLKRVLARARLRIGQRRAGPQ